MIQPRLSINASTLDRSPLDLTHFLSRQGSRDTHRTHTVILTGEREMSRRSGTCLRCCLVIFAVISALGVCGPALYWRFKKTIGFPDSRASCPPCICDCPPTMTLLKIAPGLANLSVTDCGSNDPDLKLEMEKQFVDLLSEELKLQEAVAQEHAHHMNITLAEAKRVASQYQKEAEKCNAATETCEEARERSEAMLIRERRITSIWEQRARQLGYEGE